MTVEKQQEYSGIRKPKKATANLQLAHYNQTGSISEEEDDGITNGLSLKQQDGDA